MEKHLKMLLVGLPMVILGACSADEPESNGNNGIADKTEIRYLKVNIVNAGSGSTRAIGDMTDDEIYENGTDDENKIRTVDFYLYDADKNYHSHVNLGLTAAQDPKAPTAGTIPSVKGFLEANVPINLIQGEKMPQYVICIINAVHSNNYYEKMSMEQAQAILLDKFYSPEDDNNGKQYLSMNNSVYYGLDEVTGKDNQLIMATPFDTDKLLTMSDLKNMTDEEAAKSIVDIYVERYAAKVKFSIADNAVQSFTSANGVTLEFEPLRWGLNAYEKSFYFLKSYREATGSGLSFEPYETMNGILFEGWNKPEHFRSFWARTPGYYDNNYPLVADDILDAGESYPYSVYYQSFKSATNTIGESQYVIESTLKGSRLTGADMPEQYLPLTSIPSVVMVGQYKINGSPLSFYTYQKNEDGVPEIYAANDGQISGVKTIMNRLLETQTVVLKRSGTGYAPVRKDDLVGSGQFVIEHPKKEVRNGLKVGGDLVTLQVNAANTDFYYYDSDSKGYIKIDSPDAITKANRLLYQNLGGAHAYINGMAFFSAPIQHWGWYRNDNDNKSKATMADWDWSIMKTGDFGIVRNHIYKIQVNTISGLGTGIISDTDPLLPPTDKVSYAVKFRVNIQKWATLPTQQWDW